MAKLFREGLCGERLKQTEIGEIPESWDVVRLGDHCQLKSGGTPSRLVPEYWGGEIPWVKTTEINYRAITATEEKITELGFENSSAKLFDKGTLLMAMYGQGVTRGRVALLGIRAATNQACAAFFPDETISTRFLNAYFTSAYEEIRELGHGANQRNLSLELLQDVKVPVPRDLEEQEQISNVVAGVQRRIEFSEMKVGALNRLFTSTLHSLITGAVRLNNLALAEANHA
jgi:type I restriction enzyme S subunit